jgi:hypothetical protein
MALLPDASPAQAIPARKFDVQHSAFTFPPFVQLVFYLPLRIRIELFG